MCFYILMLTLLSGMCIIAFFHKPWNHSKTIYIILVSVFSVWLVWGIIECVIAYNMVPRLNKHDLSMESIERYITYSSIHNVAMYERMYQFTLFNCIMAFTNLVGSLIGMKMRNKIFLITAGIIFFFELIPYLVGILMVMGHRF